MAGMTDTAPQTSVTEQIAPDTTVGTVALTVSDLDRSRAFYERSLGMRATARSERVVELRPASDAGPPLLELTGEPAAVPPPRRATGLFHFAVLVPSRAHLALALARLAQSRWPLDGASDHMVSEALYLSDPDGNGIEIYRDRPRSEWPRQSDMVRMATLPLDLDGLLRELPPDALRSPSGDASNDAATGSTLPADTRIGHVHLKVADLASAERFYGDVLGLEVMQRSYPGALFLAAGGYHHHVGLNTWQSLNGSPPPPDALGLRAFELRLPDDASLQALLRRIESAGLATEQARDGVLARDPSGNGVLLRI